ncbi:MAG: hypothetical protein M3N30_03880 [Bacteroidota bacterium]|nr:hypothetical protein [Bacteroidota bacterium]
MSSPLENFILENREKFDADSPDPKVWDKIKEKVNPEPEEVKPVRRLNIKSFLAAAAAVVLIGLACILYYSMHHNISSGNVAKSNPKHPFPDNNNLPKTIPADSPSSIVKTETGNGLTKEAQSQEPSGTTAKAATNGNEKEMYYYAKLIELKHDELKALEKDEPLLYKQFSADVQKLDSVYHLLKTQLPNNSNRELVIEAMISNLQLQIGLLNKQLDIIKQIKHSKKSAYEKAYKSV